jgi:predicted esterase
MSVTKKPLIKLLMLHGYRQSEKSFRERTGGLRKSLRNNAEFVFCSAPHLVPASKAAKEEGEKGDDADCEERGWWFSQPDRSYNAQETSDCTLGFAESLSQINEIFKVQGPFDGVFAFSQGACLAAMLCRIASDMDSNYAHIRFKFAILIAGFKSGQMQHEVYFDNKDENRCKIPTLHVIGDGDKVIPSEMSNQLLECFECPKVFRHAGGHFVPVNAEAKNAFIDFFSQVQTNV